MSSDLSIGPTSSSPVVRTTDTARAASLPAVSAEAMAAPGTPNPTLRLDPALGLVVIEFLSKSGAVTSSIPSQRQLTAYQDGTAEPPGDQTAAVHRKA